MQPTSEEIKQAKAIPLGITREELVEILGKPTDLSTGSRKYPTPSIYKYGEIEYHFQPYKNGALVFIGFGGDDDNFITLKK